MADEIYTIPEKPEYREQIRKLQDSDPASASGTFNPLIQRLVENAAAHQRRLEQAVTLEQVNETVRGYVDETVDAMTEVKGIFSQEEFDALPEEQRNRGMYIIPDGGGPAQAECGAITETETELSIAKRVASGVQVVLTVDTNNASQNTCSFHFTNEYDETEVVTLRPPSSTAQNTDLVTKAYVDGLLTSKGEDGVPSGVIVMWSGAKNAIPSGWALCNGTSGTPDLRDRFVLGAGGRYSVGAKGGEETHTLTVNEMPGHTHGFLVGDEPREGRGSVLMYVEESDTVSTRSGAIKNAGGSQSHNNMPPYYALCYIMKL